MMSECIGSRDGYLPIDDSSFKEEGGFVVTRNNNNEIIRIIMRVIRSCSSHRAIG